MENLIESDLVIFKMRYLEAGATWEDVAEKLNKTTRYINNRRKVIANKICGIERILTPPIF